MSYLSNAQLVNFGAINQTANTQALTWRFYVSSTDSAVYRQRGDWGIGKSASPTMNENTSYDNNGATHTLYCNDSATVDCDETYYYQIKGTEYASDYTTVLWSQTKSGASRVLGKSDAATPVLDDAPTLDNATTTTIRVNNALGDSFTPKTSETAVTLYIQYKATSGGTYSNFAALNSSVTGYADTTIGTTTVTGLTPDTSYTFRYHLDRTGTSNAASYYSGETTLSTLPDVPEVTTNAATNVTAGVAGVPNDGTAQLNATIDRNGKTDLEWRFAYEETVTGGTYANATAWTASTSEPETVSAGITGLLEGDEYGYRVEVRWNSGASTDEGSEVTFTVPDDPLATAEDEAQMFVYEYDATQGNDKTVYFSYRDVATSSSDRFLTTAPATLHGAADGNGDVLIYINGVLKSTNSGKPDNNITQVGSTTLYKLTLAGSTELTNEDVIVQFVDQNGPAFRDFSIHVRTVMRSTFFDIDATNVNGGGATSALKLTGLGAGHGLEAIGGASGNDIEGILGKHVVSFGTAQGGTTNTVTLAASENASNDIYNECIILMYSQGGDEQARLITDYDGSTKVATVDANWVGSNAAASDKYIILPGSRAWQTVRAAELSSVPTATSTMNDKMQMLWQRFAYKVDQTATTQTWYKSTGTAYATKTVSDDGTTQILGALA